MKKKHYRYNFSEFKTPCVEKNLQIETENNKMVGVEPKVVIFSNFALAGNSKNRHA